MRLWYIFKWWVCVRLDREYLLMPTQLSKNWVAYHRHDPSNSDYRIDRTNVIFVKKATPHPSRGTLFIYTHFVGKGIFQNWYAARSLTTEE